MVSRNVLSLVCLMLLAAMALPGCSPIGLAAGTGAAVGIASAQEGGLSSAASDIRIKTQISERWFQYDVDTFRKLHLTVDQGRVLITGMVENPDNRVEAVRLAWQVKGVQQVINEVRVAQGEGLPGYVRDQWITTRLRTALTLDREVQSINYSIDTVDGVVYLMGAAQNQAELNRVIEIARTLSNVKQVISYVKMIGEEPVAAVEENLAQ
ncbi:MAG: BON domain-containing protein [Rhodospirillales bacterium]|nr:BON domain-containing protein [Rhodospirillales bacterium]